MRVAAMNGTGVDLNIFQFDYYGTWQVFFMNAQTHIYARYGTREPKKNQNDKMVSVAGLKTVMTKVLETHKIEDKRSPPKPPGLPLLPETLPRVPANMSSGKACMHCHHVRQYGEKASPRFITWKAEPSLPESIGLTLDIDLGNVVASVAPDGRAAKAGIQPKDRIVAINGTPVFSAADLTWGLTTLPNGQPLKLRFERGGAAKDVQL